HQPLEVVVRHHAPRLYRGRSSNDRATNTSHTVNTRPAATSTANNHTALIPAPPRQSRRRARHPSAPSTHAQSPDHAQTGVPPRAASQPGHAATPAARASDPTDVAAEPTARSRRT